MDNERPHGHDTLKLRAAFVPENDPGKLDMGGITAALGHDAVKVPAILMPDGSNGPRPGFPYENFGRYVWQADAADDRSTSASRGASSGGGSMDQAHNANAAGSATTDAATAGPMPPTPTLEAGLGYVDPAKSAAGWWRATTVLNAERPAASPVAGNAAALRETGRSNGALARPDGAESNRMAEPAAGTE